jgi:hypothetical protein
MVRKIRIDRKAYIRKGHHRRSYIREDGIKVKSSYVDKTKVPRTKFNVKDRGKPGRGPKVLPKLKKGGLGFSLKGEKQSEINRKALAHARMVGERRAAGQLRALHILNKRTNPVISRKAAIAARYVYKNIGTYKGK